MIKFVKDLFLPEKIGHYYLFSEYIVGVEINKTVIIATKILLQGNSIVIDSIIEEKYETESIQNLENATEIDPLTKALQSIFSRIGYYDKVYTSISSSFVVFKELHLPFISREKISMVIGFEIEPLLPFSLHDAAIDFIITKEIPEENSSEVFVTAVQKQHITTLLEVFTKAGITVDHVVVDMVALYGLYNRIAVYRGIPGGVALIDLGSYSTRIALMVHGQLKTIRTLSKGILSITKKAATALNVSPNEILDTIIRGEEAAQSADHMKEVEKAINVLLDDINFTLTSFSAQLLERHPVSKIILVGNPSLIKEFAKIITDKINIACEQFNTNALVEDHTISVKGNITIATSQLISIGTALFSLNFSEDYNLKLKDLVAPTYGKLLKQLISIVVLMVLLFITFGVHYFIQTKRLTKEIRSSEQEALQSLKEAFINLEDETVLSDAIDTAETELEQQKETWFAFSNKSRASFLQCLLELTTKIDKKSTGLNVEQLTIAEGVITLKASVKDHEALRILDRELRQSPLLSNFEPQESLEFTMRIFLPQASKENL